MKAIVTALAAAWLAASLPTASQAQQNQVFIGATYFYCNSATVKRADEAVTKVYKSQLDRIVKDGTVISWGWLSKYVGGEWTRAGYVTASSLAAVWDGLDKGAWLMSDGHPPGPPPQERMALDETCSSGEDYIWHVLAGSDLRARRGKVAFSTYYVCDQGRETQLDVVVKSNFAPKYDKLVAAGRLTSWTWAEQIIGGKYRRLATTSAPTVKALIEAREEMAMDQAVTAICGSHQDYIWDLKDQGP